MQLHPCLELDIEAYPVVVLFQAHMHLLERFNHVVRKRSNHDGVNVRPQLP